MSQPDAAEFAEIAAQLCADPGLEPTLGNVVTLAEETLTGDCVDLLLDHHGRYVESATIAPPSLKRVVGAHVEHDEGPGLSAVREGEHVLVRDTCNTIERWPRWASAAVDLGVRSVLSVSLHDHGRAFASLNLYATEPDAFDDDALAAARTFGRHAAVAIRHAEQQATLRQAVDARHTIGLAQGMLMERHGIGADRAFSVLRRYSQDYNDKLREVARKVVGERAPAELGLPGSLDVPA